ncbi:hypothetical protein [Parvibaculum sp.]|uniref:hypothetical protein n=1 Tax=Parvibaculum sp. TaxID=2024848 RepID=UPI002728125A|nr:hypothetical protein [Parvibaculum sp.]MDO9126063.1 hypothetical protein [Parvibaculum sp.]MDP1627218.1 hypothetical protein [Parvibaculum sp.]MDP2148924.1 hypothetical protein [Parvibaculum sp.]MDP3327786.1 hypothetical protein [Parvibaculum sp.]
MRTFKIILALLIAAFCVGVTGLIYLQSGGGATGVGLLMGLVFVSFVFDNRSAIFGGGSRKPVPGGKAGVAIAQGAALTRFAEGEVRGTPNYKNG